MLNFTRSKNENVKEVNKRKIKRETSIKLTQEIFEPKIFFFLISS